jgi:hypothetical protein
VHRTVWMWMVHDTNVNGPRRRSKHLNGWQSPRYAWYEWFTHANYMIWADCTSSTMQNGRYKDWSTLDWFSSTISARNIGCNGIGCVVVPMVNFVERILGQTNRYIRQRFRPHNLASRASLFGRVFQITRPRQCSVLAMRIDSNVFRSMNISEFRRRRSSGLVCSTRL